MFGVTSKEKHNSEKELIFKAIIPGKEGNKRSTELPFKGTPNYLIKNGSESQF